jgi:hypothetical protein
MEINAFSKVPIEIALPWLIFKKILDVFYTNKKELNRPENHVTITYTGWGRENPLTFLQCSLNAVCQLEL